MYWLPSCLNSPQKIKRNWRSQQSQHRFPLESLLRGNVCFSRSTQLQRALDFLHQKLTTPPAHTHFDNAAPMLVHADATGIDIGAILILLHNDMEHVVSYDSSLLWRLPRLNQTTRRPKKSVLLFYGPLQNLGHTFLGGDSKSLVIVNPCAGLLHLRMFHST